MKELEKTDKEILKNIKILSEAVENASQANNEFYIETKAKLEFFQHLIISKYQK